MEISFYHLTAAPVNKALPALVEKGYDAGNKIWIATSKENLRAIDDGLWTFHPQKFLPHGTDKPEDHPIFVSTEIENPDKRSVLIITNGQEYKTDLGFTKVLDIFDGNIDSDLERARTRWKEYKALGHELKYWLQDEKGKWAEKK